MREKGKESETEMTILFQFNLISQLHHNKNSCDDNNKFEFEITFLCYTLHDSNSKNQKERSSEVEKNYLGYRGLL